MWLQGAHLGAAGCVGEGGGGGEGRARVSARSLHLGATHGREMCALASPHWENLQRYGQVVLPRRPADVHGEKTASLRPPPYSGNSADMHFLLFAHPDILW